METKPNLFDYNDFRKFMRDYKEYTGFSYQSLSKSVDQNNASYFSDIIGDRRKVNLIVLDKLIKLFEFDVKEAEYFRALVNYAQSNTFNESEYWFDKVIKLNNTPKKLMDEQTYAFYSKWYNPVIRALLDTFDFKKQYSIISKKLMGRVSYKEVEESITLLKDMNLIQENKSGFLKPTDKVLTIGDNIKNHCIQKCQVETINVLKDIIEQNDPGSHESTILTVSVTQKGIKRILKSINDLRSEIISIGHKDEGKANAVYNISIHAYPMSTKE